MIAMASESEAETGARIYGAAEALRKSIGMPVPASEKDDRMPFLENGWKTLGDESWERALQEGRQMGLKEAIRLAETRV